MAAIGARLSLGVAHNTRHSQAIESRSRGVGPHNIGGGSRVWRDKRWTRSRCVVCYVCANTVRTVPLEFGFGISSCAEPKSSCVLIYARSFSAVHLLSALTILRSLTRQNVPKFPMFMFQKPNSSSIFELSRYGFELARQLCAVEIWENVR